MKAWWRRWSCLALGGVLYLALATGASAQVVVTVDGNVAYATISLTDNNGATYDADVTITFDTPVNLSPESLNLTAELVDPTSADLQARIGTPPQCLELPLLPPLCSPGVQVDPRFPVKITVEPVDFAWLFSNGFDGGDAAGALEFLNTYDFEVHTHDLLYTDESPYRLFKAPIGGPFHDVTNDVNQGSVRVRGRGGEFSEFLVIEDTRSGLTVALLKIVDLNARILLAAIADGLRLDLLALLAQVDALILIDLGGAIDVLDQLIALLLENEGTNIPNVWTAHHDEVNDAGLMEELAFTLRFSMLHPGSPNPP
jgi:uncharacterized protein DUF6689